MAGNRSFYTVLVALQSALVFAQEPPPQAPPPPPPPEERPDRPPPSEWPGKGRRNEAMHKFWERFGNDPDGMKNRLAEEIERLTPEQRKELFRAVWAVLRMPPEKKKEVIGEDEGRRKRVKEEVERAIQESGIEVDEARKRELFMRYFAERRSIEQQLRREMDERRRILMKDATEKLKQEFGKKAEEVKKQDQ
jgi:hypothetical protein